MCRLIVRGGDPSRVGRCLPFFDSGLKEEGAVSRLGVDDGEKK